MRYIESGLGAIRRKIEDALLPQDTQIVKEEYLSKLNPVRSRTSAPVC